MKNRKIVKKFILNAFLNLVASFIPLCLLQILILPLVSEKLPADHYGLALTIISLLNVCPGVLGIALNNIKLLEDKDDTIDFSKIVKWSSVFIFLVMAILSSVYECGINFSIVLTAILSVLWFLREFLIVKYQKALNYKRVLLNNIIMSLGYLVGYFIFTFTAAWQMIYIFGCIFALLEILWNSSREKSISKDKNFPTKNIRYDYYKLTFSTVLIRITNYADKLIIYPIMGGEQVSIYYAATIVSKLVSMAISPISSVLLSYFAGLDRRPTKLITRGLCITAILSAVGYFATVLSSRIVLSLLYPNFVDSATALVHYTSLSTMLYIVIAIVNPLILKFFAMKWQIIINGSFSIIYIITSVLCLIIGDIKTFCIGNIVVNVCKLAIMLLVFYKSKPDNKNDQYDIRGG